LRTAESAAILIKPYESPRTGSATMMSPSNRDTQPVGNQAAADLLRQLLAEERARSDQLLEAMTAWQLRARMAEERLLALSGAAPTQVARPQRESPTSAAAAPSASRPTVWGPGGDTDRTATVLPPVPEGDPVFAKHPLYRGRRFGQLVGDFTKEAAGAQRQYAALASKSDRTRKDEIALGLLDAEWAAIGGADWPSADPRRLAEHRVRYEYRFETDRRSTRVFGLPVGILVVCLIVVVVAVVLLAVVIL
jgi:hypothetical protein